MIAAAAEAAVAEAAVVGAAEAPEGTATSGFDLRSRAGESDSLKCSQGSGQADTDRAAT